MCMLLALLNYDIRCINDMQCMCTHVTNGRASLWFSIASLSWPRSASLHLIDLARTACKCVLSISQYFHTHTQHSLSTQKVKKDSTHTPQKAHVLSSAVNTRAMQQRNQPFLLNEAKAVCVCASVSSCCVCCVCE